MIHFQTLITFKFQVLLLNVNDHNKSTSIITPYLAFNNKKVSWESNLQSKAKCFDPYYFFDQFQSNCSTRFFANRKLFIFCSKLLMHFFLSNFFFFFRFLEFVKEDLTMDDFGNWICCNWWMEMIAHLAGSKTSRSLNRKSLLRPNSRLVF